MLWGLFFFEERKVCIMQNVSSGTIARTIVLILALINQVFAIMGKGTINIAEEDVYQLCSIVATIVTAAIAWWKNNSFSAAAIAGDDTKQKVKLGIENVDAEKGISEDDIVDDPAAEVSDEDETEEVG